jgi:hypothetical protein
MLTESPEAFGASYEEAVVWKEIDWEKSLTKNIILELFQEKKYPSYIWDV